MRRFLILNADDFAFSPVVNAAIRKAHCEGVLTSASLMVAEEGFDEAVTMAREMPRLGVGLHLVVTHDRPLLPPSALPRLTQPNGKFDSDLFRVGLRYAFSAAAQKELAAEIEAQFARFAETGLPWSHVDGHQHFHLPPVVWDQVVRLCERYEVRRLRYPSEPIRQHLRSGGRGVNLDTVASLFFRLLRRRNLRRLREAEARSGKPFFLCDRVYGHLQTGRMNIDYTTRLLARLDAPSSEIYFHPGAPHAQRLPLSERTEAAQDVELHTLLSPELRKAIAAQNILTGTYAEAETLSQMRSRA